MSDVLRLIGGVVFACLASLTFISASTRLMWGAGLAATEYGYWLACAALLPLIPTRRQTRLGKMGAVLSMGAVGLFLVRLRYHEDREPADVAKELGLEPGHVRVLLNRVREALRTCIERRLRAGDPR